MLKKIIGSILLSILLSSEASLATEEITPEEKYEVESCSDFENISEKNKCTQNILILNNVADSEACYLITPHKYSTISPQICIKEMATRTKNSELCQEAGQYQEACLHEVAIATEDPAICDQITENKIVRGMCDSDLAVLKANLSFCEAINDQRIKDKCYQKIAIVKQDSIYCKKISKGHYQKECYSKTPREWNNYWITKYISNLGPLVSAIILIIFFWRLRRKEAERAFYIITILTLMLAIYLLMEPTKGPRVLHNNYGLNMYGHVYWPLLTFLASLFMKNKYFFHILAAINLIVLILTFFTLAMPYT